MSGDLELGGRWTLLPTPPETAPTAEEARTALEHAARVLLRRYGVVARWMLEGERLAPSWQDLVPVYQRLVWQDELRSGYFIEGVAGLQFALPEALGLLHAQIESPGGCTGCRAE